MIKIGNIEQFAELTEESLYFSGNSVHVQIGGNEAQPFSGLSLDAAYIQFSPNQAMIPIYSIYNSNPTLFGQGNSLVRGIIGFNFTLGSYITGLLDEPDAEYYGTDAVWREKPELMQNGSLYIPFWRILFYDEDGLSLDTGNSEMVLVPSIEIYDSFLSGGVVTVALDGNPIQDIYQFVGKKYKRMDRMITIGG